MANNNVGGIVKFAKNNHGTGTRGNPLAGMKRSTITPDATYKGGGKAPGKSTGAVALPGKAVPIAPAKKANLKTKM